MKVRQVGEIKRVMAMLAIFSLTVLAGCAEHKEPMMGTMKNDIMSKEQPMNAPMMKDNGNMEKSMEMKKSDTMMQ